MQTLTATDVLSSIGKKLESTGWFLVSQEQINLFADCTLDHQFIHIDPEKARKTPFGSTIAHGFLSLSMLSHFAETFSLVVEGMSMGINYGFNKIRFIAPVEVDSSIRCHAILKDAVEKSPGQFLLTYDVEVEIHGHDKPALKAEWISMQFIDNNQQS